MAAAYLAKAGYRCLVLEGRSVLGGNVVTEELTLPGFRHDSCGTAHVILQDSPMMRNDELGLADYGLEYVHPEIACHAPFLDGSYLTQYHDIERTIEQFAKFSKKDAAAYRRMIAEYEAVKPLFDAASYTPIGFGKPINDRLNEHPDGKKWLRRQAQSAWEIIRDNFEDDHCRCFMLWMAFQTVTPPEWPMTGRLAYSLVWGRQRWDDIKHQVADANLNWLRKFSPNLTDDKILARVVESPLDLERRNPHNWHGSCHGGAQNAAQAAALRPAPGWAQHRMPIAGLYQTGSTTHPGGSISGGPGRNAATVMLKDFGRSLDELVADKTASAPARSAALAK